MMRIAVFISGNGSNLEAIIKGCQEGIISGEVLLVVSSKSGVYGLERAKRYGIPIYLHTGNERELISTLKSYAVDYMALAGYMRLVGKDLLNAYPGRIINIHPSLLPKYRGLDAIGQAIAAGEEVMGVTVHYVDGGMDTGEIIAQSSFPVEKGMTREEIEGRIHELEHKLYPEVLGKLGRRE